MFRGAAAEYDKVKTYTRTHFINIDIQIPTLQLDNYNYRYRSSHYNVIVLVSTRALHNNQHTQRTTQRVDAHKGA